MSGEEESNYKRDGFVILKSALDLKKIHALHEEVRVVFKGLFARCGIEVANWNEQAEVDAAIKKLFNIDNAAFVSAVRGCNNLISLHQLFVDPTIMKALNAVNVTFPAACGRPVMLINSPDIAKMEAHYKTPKHQDWRSMQGSLDSVVVWIPMVSVDEAVGALRVVPGSHQQGLYESEPDDWFRHIADTRINEDDFVSVPMEVGDVLIFSAFLVHQSGDNISKRIRWSLQFRYNNIVEPTFVERNYPNPYIHRPNPELLHPDFPQSETVQALFKDD